MKAARASLLPTARASTQEKTWTRILASVQWNIRGESDEMEVFELAEAGLDVALGAVGGDDVGDRPVVAVGDQDPFAEDLGFQGVLGGGVDAEAQPRPAGTSPVSLG
jgi:hypothetical protein